MDRIGESELAHLAAIDGLRVTVGGGRPSSSLTTSIPVVVDARTVGRLIVTAHDPVAFREPDRELNQQLNRLHLLAAVLPGGVGMLAALLAAVPLARPLRRLTDGVRRMEQGELDARVDPAGGAEMEQLARALNRPARSCRRSGRRGRLGRSRRGLCRPRGRHRYRRGFGVYPAPIAALASRYDRRLEDLTGATAGAIVRHLLAGRAVMAWVGLEDGPYRSWRSPSGRPIRVSLNEHTVVLNGVNRDGSLSVVNVLEGTRETWTRDEFERAWELLGRRALGA